MATTTPAPNVITALHARARAFCRVERRVLALLRRLVDAGRPVTPTGRAGGNVGAEQSRRLAVHTPRLLPMDAAREQRAVAAFTALLIPPALGGHIADTDRLDSAGRIESSLVHDDQ